MSDKIFFEENQKDNEVNYSNIIKKLEKDMRESEVLNYIIDNMDSIVKKSGSNFPKVVEELSYLLHFASSDQIQELDENLVKNIDNILKIRISKGGYDIDELERFPKFIEEIQKRGPEFFINFPITNSKREYQKIAEKFFGKYDEEIFCIFEFGRYDKTKAEMMKYVVSELINASSKGTTVKNIKEIGSGSYSVVYKIGDYTLKIGDSRAMPEIPNHRRLLQPIIRRRIITDINAKEDCKVQDFFEVQNYVDTSCLESMYPDQKLDILYEIYSELRDDGYVWLDPSYKNIGKLLKPNKTNLQFIDIDGKEQHVRPIEWATGVIRRKH